MDTNQEDGYERRARDRKNEDWHRLMSRRLLTKTIELHLIRVLATAIVLLSV